jgi:hypothetical protein
VRRWDPLNDRQLGVLRRIAEGAESVTSLEPALATTVYALRGRRGLVSTPQSKGGRRAEITRQVGSISNTATIRTDRDERAAAHRPTGLR